MQVCMQITGYMISTSSLMEAMIDCLPIVENILPNSMVLRLSIAAVECMQQ
jgi:hypothetical protein